VLTHLLSSLQPTIPAISEKDDADFPGEVEYVKARAGEWGLDLRIVQPAESAIEWLRARRDRFDGVSELHARSSEFARVFFYDVIEQAMEPFDCVFMGLRGEESGTRQGLFERRRATYQLKSGQWHSSPLAYWRGIDVYAYALNAGIPLLHVYHCIGFIHRQRPWEVRKSWWLPGRYAAHSQAGWLRRYYPSLYDRWRELFPDALRLI
jgi:3'-phosphoadenosine 5'-phosphosulfate sulfotransferase (PAPS reductase)/FAD synthetase